MVSHQAWKIVIWKVELAYKRRFLIGFHYFHWAENSKRKLVRFHTFKIYNNVILLARIVTKLKLKLVISSNYSELE